MDEETGRASSNLTHSGLVRSFTNPTESSYREVFYRLVTASAQTGAAVGFSIGLIAAFKSPHKLETIAAPLVCALFGSVLGPLIALPAILLGAWMIVFLINTQRDDGPLLVLVGTTLGCIYGALVHYGSLSFSAVLFGVSGGIAGAIVRTTTETDRKETSL